MSNAMLDRAFALAPRMADLLTAVPAKRRPSPERAQYVSLVLADRYRDHRGCVDETVEQIARRTTFGPGAVSRCLRALDEAGVWLAVPGHRGGRHGGTRRIAGPHLTRVDSRELESSTHAGQSAPDRESTHADTGLNSRGYGAQLTRVDPRTPPSPINPPTRSRSRDDAPGRDLSVVGGEAQNRADLSAVFTEAIGFVERANNAKGWAPERPVAYRASLLKLCHEHAGTVAGWLAYGVRPYDAARALASRITDDPHATPMRPSVSDEPDAGDERIAADVVPYVVARNLAESRMAARGDR